MKCVDAGIEGRNGSQLAAEILENNNINNDDSGAGDGSGGDGSVSGGKKKTVALLSASDKQGSAIDLDIGPPLDEAQTLNYRTIQKILIRMNRLCVQCGFGSNANSTNIGNELGNIRKRHGTDLSNGFDLHSRFALD